jgi:DNA end-binding protein Ku
MLRPAVREGRIALRMLDQDGTPLSRRYYCPKDEREVHPEHLVRGYEIEPEKYVVITDEELASLEPEKSRDIDLRLFVDAEQVDPIYFERSYFLMPDRDSNKAYRLLAETMQRARKIGIATFVMHDREHLVAIIAAQGLLRAEIMRFHDEVRRPEDVDLPAPAAPGSDETAKVEKAVHALTEPRLSAAELRSRNLQRLQALIERKRKEGKDVVEVQVAEAEGGRNVSDLMA